MLIAYSNIVMLVSYDLTIILFEYAMIKPLVFRYSIIMVYNRLFGMSGRGPVLSHVLSLVLSCHVLSCPVLPCPLSCSLSCPVLSTILARPFSCPCPVLSMSPVLCSVLCPVRETEVLFDTMCTLFGRATFARP